MTQTVTIDNQQYDLDSLSDAAKAALVHLQAVDLELVRLNMQQAIHQTARTAYANALNEELKKITTAA